MYGFNFSNKGIQRALSSIGRVQLVAPAVGLLCEETFLFKDIFSIGHILAAIYLSWGCVREKLLQMLVS